MDQLYIEIEIRTNSEETEVYTSVPSFLALYIYRFLRSSANVQLIFVHTVLPADSGKLKLRSERLKRELTDNDILCKEAAELPAIRDLRLPLYVKENNIYIAGMCAVCREIIQRQQTPEHHKLLGFKGSCLLAPAECSVWTRFCEVDVINALQQLLLAHSRGQLLREIPVEVVRFEQHMNEPVRMHNIYKLAREQANKGKKRGNAKKSNKVIIECRDMPKEQLPIEHRFAEGVTFTIADLLLYPSFRLIFEHYGHMLMHFPLTSTWLNEIDTFETNCAYTLTDLYAYQIQTESFSPTRPLLLIPDCEATSLYKSDPKRYKPRKRIYTEQSEVEQALAKLQSLQIEFSSECPLNFGQEVIDWSAIEPEHDKTSALPEKRLERKRQQLQNLANAAIFMASTGDRIVDFCSGTGHLGILLALQLPQCTVILMENKALSLLKAKERADALGLSNCHFYQCNIDYFVGKFQLGTSLHACGTATDIVLQQCQRSKAQFISCPCCYGNLQPMPHISYPLSRRFRSVIEEKDFLHIAHAADQAHALGTANCKPETTRQGQLCMDIVDFDRKLQAEEEGYDVILTRLQPEHCTPKNRLLLGKIRKGS